jgi:hypothetical protein
MIQLLLILSSLYCDPKTHKFLYFAQKKAMTLEHLKEQTFSSILALDTKSKIEIYRILKRHTADPVLVNDYDALLTRLKNNQALY